MNRRRAKFWFLQLSIAILIALPGCSTLRRGAVCPQDLLPEQIASPRSQRVYVDFRLLEGPQPPEHIIGPKDILGVYIADVLGDRDELPSVSYPSFRVDRDPIKPFVGHPVPVETDGTIHLPFIEPLVVNGLTMTAAKDSIRRAYSESSRMIERGRENIQVTLITPRSHRIHIFRQDTRYSVPGLQNAGQFEISRRWAGTTLFLQPNDASVLSALLRTGGLPGIDARNEIWVMKGVDQNEVPNIAAMLDVPSEKKIEGTFPIILPKEDSNIIRIPLMYPMGQELPFQLEDCLLGDGDVVFLPRRDGDTFLTGGLLPAGRYPLDRDRDLDVIEAIAKAQGNALQTHGTTNTRFVAGPGGVCAPTQVVIVRRISECEQIKIVVDLKKAMDDPTERVLISPGDLILLQYKPAELTGNILLNLFNFNFTINRGVGVVN